MYSLLLVTVLLFNCAFAQDTSRIRKMTFTNLCTEPVWVGSWAMLPNGTQDHPLNGGWAMNAGESQIVMVSGLLTAARFWPRTGCKTQNGGAPSLSNPLRCDTGDCWNPTNNGLQCAGITGQPPATLFEITFTGLGAAKDDTYDLSVVDGYNVGIAVQSVGGFPLGGQWNVADKYNCGGTQCTFNTAQNCPPELKDYGTDGILAGCSSICTAVKSNVQNSYLDAIRNGVDNKTGYPLTNLVCCDCAAGPGVGCDNSKCEYGCSPLDTSNPGGKCFVQDWPLSSTGIGYQNIYMNDCPDSYAWQFADQTSTFHCIDADYNVQFCPENAASSVQASPGVPIVQSSASQSSQAKSQSFSAEPQTSESQAVSEDLTSEGTTDDFPVITEPIGQQNVESSNTQKAAAPLQTGAIIGIVVGGTAFVLVMASVVVVGIVLRRRKAIQGIETSQNI